MNLPIRCLAVFVPAPIGTFEVAFARPKSGIPLYTVSLSWGRHLIGFVPDAHILGAGEFLHEPPPRFQVRRVLVRCEPAQVFRGFPVADHHGGPPGPLLTTEHP